MTQDDAANYNAPEPLDGVLFGFSYNTMPHHLAVLEHALRQLRPGGRLVIMDAKLPPGRGGQLILPFSLGLTGTFMLLTGAGRAGGRRAAIDRGRVTAPPVLQ